jgi:hypothetical protein
VFTDVSAPMQSSECRKYAEQCAQLAEQLDGEPRDALVEMAQRWLRVAAELEARERQASDQGR